MSYRRHLFWLPGFLLFLATAALAGPPTRVEIPPEVRQHLLVFTNQHGRYLVVPTYGDRMPVALRNKLKRNTFFGDAKHVYRQRIRNTLRRTKTGGFKVYISDFRMRIANLEVDAAGRAVMHCEQSKRPLVPLPPAQAQRFLGRVTAHPFFWTHEPHLLARDDDGVYYYVDRKAIGRWGAQQRQTSGLRGFRLWIGRRGQMKPIKLRDAVLDAAGQIFLTKRGALHLDWKGRSRQIHWRRGKKRKPLTNVPVVGSQDTAILIHRHLGPYAGLRFHMPCEEL